jgi:pyruvate kinase
MLTNGWRGSQLGPDEINEAIASSAVKTALDLRASLILCLTETGRTARLISKYKPMAPVICATSDEGVARQCLVLRGCYPMVVGSMIGSASLISRCLTTAKVNGLCKEGDVCVVISGMKEGVTGGTNVLRVLRIE